MFLHRLDSWDSLELLHTFSGFSRIQLFKPEKKHSTRSYFYLIAKGVNPYTPYALRAVEAWKRAWSCATFHFRREDAPSNSTVKAVLDQFGEQFAKLGGNI